MSMRGSLAKELKKLHIKHKEFAEMIGVRPETISTWVKHPSSMPKYAEFALDQLSCRDTIIDLILSFCDLMHDEAKKISREVYDKKIKEKDRT